MKDNNIERWRSAIMTMPDSSFFELLRTVFGKIKTPFNKQQLLNDLEKFLLRQDIQNTIAAFIDENDTKVIAAVSLFGEPTREELNRFFTGEFSNIQLQGIIVNLEERFILYQVPPNLQLANPQFSESRLALNPILDKVLSPVAANLLTLFPQTKPSEKIKKPSKPASAFNNRTLAGLFSFVSFWEGTAFFKKEGQLRKQILDAAKICFPGYDLDETLGSLRILGLFYTEGENLYCDKKRFADFASLSAQERMEYCAAGLIVYNHIVLKEAGSSADIQAPYFKNRIKEAVSFIHLIMESLYAVCKNFEKDSCFSETMLARLIEVLKSRTCCIVINNHLIEALLKTELVLKAGDSLYKLNYSLLNANSSLPCITIDSGFSVFVYPEIDFTDAIELASFLNLKEAGAIVRLELEKSSAVRAFDSGISAQHIIDTLNHLSNKNVPKTLEYNLKDWEKRHGEVSIKKGIVLTLAKDKHYLAQTMPLSALITETLAPGVYLLNENAAEPAASALQNAGIDIINRSRITGKNQNITQASAPLHRYYHALSGYLTDKKLKHLFSNVSMPKKEKSKSAGIIFDQSSGRAVLEKMTLNKNDRDELSARIDRRLILCEAQLKDASIRYEKLEARNMDYAGKQNIAKHAISVSSPLEIEYTAGKLKKQIYGIPTALEKEGTDHILIIAPEGNDSGIHCESIRIPLAKISLLRRIKKSIFEK